MLYVKLNGQYYMRSKGDYCSGKQMRKDPYLKRTMANADQFGVASRIVKYTYYHQLPPEARKFGLFAQLTGMVKRWLQEGKSKEEAEELLIAYMQTLVEQQKSAATPVVNSLPAVRDTGVKKQVTHSDMTVPAGAPEMKMPVLHAPPKLVKQARFLSNWKVRRNGRLQMCQPANQGLMASPLLNQKNVSPKGYRLSIDASTGADSPKANSMTG